MRLSKRLRAFITAAITGALVLGVGVSAQAYLPTYEAKRGNAMTRVDLTRPDCFGLDCKSQETYDNVLLLLDNAIRSKDDGYRAGVLNQLLFTVMGKSIVNWQGGNPGKVVNYEFLNAMHDLVPPAPTDSQMACFGNVYLGYITGPGQLQNFTNDLYDGLEQFTELKDKYGEAVDAYKLASAFENETAARAFIKDTLKAQARESIEQVLGIKGDSMLDLYVQMVLDSRSPVNYYGMSSALQARIFAMGKCGTDGASNMPQYTTKSVNVSFAAQKLFPKRLAGYPGYAYPCKNAPGGAITCVSGKASVCVMSVFNQKVTPVPAKITKLWRAIPVIRSRIGVDVSGVKGAVWRYMSPNALAAPVKVKKPGTTYTKLAMTKTWSDLGGWGVNICMQPHAKVTVKRVTMQFQYTILR